MATAGHGLMPPGARVPSFTLPRPDGGQVTVPDPSAPGLTLLVFYKDTCPTCRFTFPFLQRLHEQVEARGARVLAVSQDGLDGASAFARELGLTLPIAADGDAWPVSSRYGLVAVPTLYLLERDGTVVRSLAGFNKHELDRIGADLAGSVGASRPTLYREGEAVPDLKPG